MKKILKISTLVLLASCGGKESTETADILTLENPSFTADTLEVKVGDEVFNATGYFGSDLSKDENTAYLYYNAESEIHEIDLASMTLVARHPFEKDGPNKIPSFINFFQALPRNEFLIANYSSTGVYSLSGEFLQKLDITHQSVSGFDEEKGAELTDNIHLTEDKVKAISLPRTFPEGISGLGVIDLESMTGLNLELPAMKITEKYRVIYRHEGGSSFGGDVVKLQVVNGNFVIYSGATSDVYMFDPVLDSLSLLTFPHQLVPKSKMGNYPLEVDSRERVREIQFEMAKEINFGKFYWDSKNERYIRFAQKNKYDVEGKMSIAEFFVFTYSKDFKLVAEGELKNFNPIHFINFLRDGKLYSYTTVDENPGFVVYALDF